MSACEKGKGRSTVSEDVKRRGSQWPQVLQLLSEMEGHELQAREEHKRTKEAYSTAKSMLKAFFSRIDLANDSRI